MQRATSVDAYIKAAPKDVQPKLKELRALIKSSAKVEEKISYGMPYYGYKGRFAYFAYAKGHVGLYVMPPTVQNHKKELKGYVTAKATVQFPLEKKLPIALIKKLLKASVKQNEERAKGKLTICSRGHRFYKSSTQPTCPICWPGRYAKKGSRT
jgi:uncharacterized protein YdhG (YjbR/CyaY superfamily)